MDSGDPPLSSPPKPPPRHHPAALARAGGPTPRTISRSFTELNLNLADVEGSAAPAANGSAPAASAAVVRPESAMGHLTGAASDRSRAGTLEQTASPEEAPHTVLDTGILRPHPLRASASALGLSRVAGDLPLELVYPEFELSEPEQRTIRFNSFPDSNSFFHGDLTFSFTIRRTRPATPAAAAPPPQPAAANGARLRSESLNVALPSMDDEFLYASVFFRQKPDPSIRRGYYQKSVVLISRLPLAGLWDRVVSLVGPVVCEMGVPALETAINNIAKWPAPAQGMLDLPILGHVLQCHIPALPPLPCGPQLLPASVRNLAPHHVLASTLPTAVFPTFRDVLDHLWTLWELVLINEPLGVISSCPAVASRVIEGLVTLIRPIPMAATYRPYSTIQDPDFKFLTKHHPPPRTLLGVTNPHFHNALDRWPHILQVGPPRTPLGKPKAGAPTSLDIVPGLTTRYKRVVARDQAVLAQVASLTLANAADVAVDNVVRRHFADLTERFLAPLHKYQSSLWPASISLFSAYPVTPTPFRQDVFLADLERASPPPLPLRANRWITGQSDAWLDLYRAFLRTPHFAAWSAHRHQVDAERLASQYVSHM
ncbi:hypothetical protein H9P43_003356 [Blastocladiella emersonii ATCC 22665]|nr:hypothetical protein H9P43_003356 [Blastocladiella emersonii ATCC 22665]